MFLQPSIRRIDPTLRPPPAKRCALPGKRDSSSSRYRLLQFPNKPSAGTVLWCRLTSVRELCRIYQANPPQLYQKIRSLFFVFMNLLNRACAGSSRCALLVRRHVEVPIDARTAVLRPCDESSTLVIDSTAAVVLVHSTTTLIRSSREELDVCYQLCSVALSVSRVPNALMLTQLIPLLPIPTARA